MSRPVDGSCADPAVVGVYVDVAAAHDGENVSAGEAVAVFEDRCDAERGRRFDDEAGVVKEHPHTGDDRRLLDQDGVVLIPLSLSYLTVALPRGVRRAGAGCRPERRRRRRRATHEPCPAHRGGGYVSERRAGLAPAFPRRKRGIFPWTTDAVPVDRSCGDQLKIPSRARTRAPGPGAEAVEVVHHAGSASVCAAGGGRLPAGTDRLVEEHVRGRRLVVVLATVTSTSSRSPLGRAGVRS